MEQKNSYPMPTRGDSDIAIANQQPRSAGKKHISRDEFEEYMKAEQQKDEQLVCGVFRNLEHDGVGAKIVRKKYANHTLLPWNFIDGHTYSIPIYLAKHINQECYYTIYENIRNPLMINDATQLNNMANRNNDANPYATMKIARKKHRYAFYPLDYGAQGMDIVADNLILPEDKDEIIKIDR